MPLNWSFWFESAQPRQSEYVTTTSTPLHVAVQDRRLDVANVLKISGMSTTALDRWGNPADAAAVTTATNGTEKVDRAVEDLGND